MSELIGRLNTALSGRYRIERQLGEGGMATVFLADDIRHERKVALKVLKPELAAVVGADRFLAEIKTTANLQHPHVLPLYDSGEAASFLFYVMPYVEGETLRDRIDREKQLPVDDVVRLAVAIAQALDYAHRHGIVHRDIKPGNILIQDGQPVVGDFGIALAVGSAGGARLTETGLSVGTPYYMSPEQATGDLAVGPASDIYALAAVVYEMLTGEPPYTGTTAQAVLGRIIQGAPVSATEIRRSVPGNVDAAIRKGLEKLAADRFASASEFAEALKNPAFRHGADPTEAAGAVPGPWRWVAAAAVVASLGLTAALAREMNTPEPLRPIERFAMPFLPGDELTFLGEAGYRMSPDGRMIVYRIVREGGQILVVRRWDELRATPIRETEAALNPAVSWDGLELAFEHNGAVKVLAFAGGPVRTLIEPGFFPVWGPDGYVYAAVDSGLARAPATGGALEIVVRRSEGEDGLRPFDVLPGGERMLYSAAMNGFADVEVRGLDLESGVWTTITPGSHPYYVASGHLVYLLEGVMMAARFDPKSMELLDPPIAIMDGLASFSLSTDGKLFYTTGQGGLGGSIDQVMQLLWVDRDGEAEPIDPNWTFVRGGPDAGWRVSPDGTQIAVRERTTDGNDIWIKQLDLGPRSRLTFGEAEDRMPIWGPGPGEVTFLSDRDGDLDVWIKAADGTGEPRRILDFDRSIATMEWSPDREWIVLRTAGPRAQEGNRDIYAFRPGVDSTAQPLLAAEGYDEINPDLSPDGRFIAYQSTETDRHEVYVRPFPDVTGGRWQISVDGGRGARWANSGREIFFQGPDNEMMVVDVETSPTFRAATPRVLFETQPDWVTADLSGTFFELTPDDQRFVIARNAPIADVEDDAPTAILVNNFAEELRARLGGGR